jgi:hypothetical protein
MMGDQQIERRAAAALASGGTVGLDEFDLVLTDAAAEAVSVRVELLRVNNRLAAVLNGCSPKLETLDRARELAGRRRELSLRRGAPRRVGAKAARATRWGSPSDVHRVKPRQSASPRAEQQHHHHPLAPVLLGHGGKQAMGGMPIPLPL